MPRANPRQRVRRLPGGGAARPWSLGAPRGALRRGDRPLSRLRKSGASGTRDLCQLRARRLHPLAQSLSPPVSDTDAEPISMPTVTGAMMKYFLIAAAALLPAWSAAVAQDGEDLRVRVGAGAQVRPDFIGSDSTEVAPLWRLNVARGTDPFKFSAPDYSFGVPLISSGGFSVGPAAN